MKNMLRSIVTVTCAAATFMLAVPLAWAAASVRTVIEFRIPRGSHPYVGAFQDGKNPIYQTGEFLIDGRVVGTWNIRDPAEATRVFRTEVQGPPGQTIGVAIRLPRTGYPPMGLTVTSKERDSVYSVDWFIDSITVAGNKPLGEGGEVAAGPAGVLQPVGFDLGRRWTVRETMNDGSVWEGVWIRRGNSEVFDASWRLNGRGGEARDVLEVKGLRGGRVEIYRRGLAGTYYGTLSADRRSITQGTASWYRGERWEASIEGGSAGGERVDDDAVAVSAGSHQASQEVLCRRGTERYVDNWVRSCILARNQTFQQVTFRNPGQPPTTAPVQCARGRPASFDGYGYLIGC